MVLSGIILGLFLNVAHIMFLFSGGSVLIPYVYKGVVGAVYSSSAYGDVGEVERRVNRRSEHPRAVCYQSGGTNIHIPRELVCL